MTLGCLRFYILLRSKTINLLVKPLNIKLDHVACHSIVIRNVDRFSFCLQIDIVKYKLRVTI